MKQRMQALEPITDEPQIIERAIRGEKQAFGLLFEKYSPAIYKYLLIRLGSHDEAEDMTETVFIKAWESLPTLKKSDKNLFFRAWLYRIAHNSFVDFIRMHKVEVSIDAILELQDKDRKPETVLEDQENSLELLNAVKLLDEKSKQTIINRFIAGLSTKETSRVMGLSEGNVRIIQYRALKKLNGILGEKNE